MAKLKNERVTYICPETRVEVNRTFALNVSTEGVFYAYVAPEDQDLYAVAEGRGIEPAKVDRYKHGAPRLSVQAPSLSELIEALEQLLSGLIKAEKREEYVIAYLVHTTINFAENEAGDVAPNAEADGFSWADSGVYGRDSATHYSLGYELILGARVMVKETVISGDGEKVTYSKGYPEDSEAAARLNAWTRLKIPDPNAPFYRHNRDVKELPFTEEGAEFFSALLEGMAKLIKRIKDATLAEDDVVKLIEAHANTGQLLLGRGEP